MMHHYQGYPKFLLFILWTILSSTASAQSGTAFPYPPPGKLVDIGGWQLHLHGQGTDKKGPTVILEAGVGDFSFDWSLVQPVIAAFSPVYSYDRAGSAWSDMGPKPHTMQQTVYNLHTLLHKAKVPGPYILVGASYGATLVRLFAQQYPKEVAGMVLVDPGIEDSKRYINGKVLQPSVDAKGIPVPPVKTAATQADNELSPEAQKFLRDILAQQGLPARQIPPPYDKLPLSLQQIRLEATAQLNYYAVNDNNYNLEEEALMIREREKRPFMFGRMPLIVMTRGMPYEQERIDAHKKLLALSHNSKQVIAEKSGHHIQLEDPDLVVKAVREVMMAVKANKKLTE
jgi:pimeloyl-ACP methyl ester carboxylesterase